MSTPQQRCSLPHGYVHPCAVQSPRSPSFYLGTIVSRFWKDTLFSASQPVDASPLSSFSTKILSQAKNNSRNQEGITLLAITTLPNIITLQQTVIFTSPWKTQRTYMEERCHLTSAITFIIRAWRKVMILGGCIRCQWICFSMMTAICLDRTRDLFIILRCRSNDLITTSISKAQGGRTGLHLPWSQRVTPPVNSFSYSPFTAVAMHTYLDTYLGTQQWKPIRQQISKKQHRHHQVTFSERGVRLVLHKRHVILGLDSLHISHGHRFWVYIYQSLSRQNKESAAIHSLSAE